MSWGVDPNLALPHVCNGRLSLHASDPVPASDVTAATNVYWHPLRGNRVALYTGSGWRLYTSSGVKSVAVPATTSLPFDVFVYDNSGTLALETTDWSSDTTRAVALATIDGVYVKSGSATRRYLGTGRTTSVNGQSEDSQLRRLLWNDLHRIRRKMKRVETTDNWSYGTSAWRSANNSGDNRVELVVGLQEAAVSLSLLAASAQSGAAGARYAGIGIDRTNGNDADIAGEPGNDLAWHAHAARIEHVPTAGYHFYQWVERGAGAGTTTWYGDFGTSGDMQCGLVGTIEA